METIFRWSASRPFAALGAALILCLALSAGMAHLKIDATLERLLSEKDPRRLELVEVRENFGDRPFVLVLAESPALFERDTLLALRSLSLRLAEIPGFAGTANVFDTPFPKPGDGLAAIPILSNIPGSPELLDAKRSEILSHGMIRDHLVNRRGDAMLLVFFLDPEAPGGNRHDHLLDEFLETLRNDPASATPGLALTPFGVPLVQKALQDHLLQDLLRLGPISLLIVCATIFVFYRSLPAVLLPAVTGVPSVFATLGFMGWAGFEINVLLSTVVVIILVIGCTEDLHIVSEYLDNLADGLGQLESIGLSGAAIGKALLLTSSTTVLSFLSIAFTGFDALREFAFSCAFGLAANFLVTVLAVPAFLALCPPGRKVRSNSPAFLAAFGGRLEKGFHHRSAAMALVCVGLLAASASGLPRLKSETDHDRFFRPESDNSQSIARMQGAFDGTAHLTVTVETGQRNGFADPERYRDLAKLHEFLAREVGAPLDLVVLFNEFRRTKGGAPAAGSADPTAAELARFLKQLPREATRPFLDYDGSRAAIRLIARGDTTSSREILEIERRIAEFAAAELAPSVSVRVTGEVIVVAHLCDLLVGKLLGSLLLLAVATALLIALLMRSARQGLLALVPNLFPVATTFGAMGWLGIPLDIATFPIAIIAFGIATDDTIHLLARFNLRRRAGLPPSAAAAESLRKELRPIVATSAAVAFGYLAMSLSPLRVHAETGLLFALAVFSACLADLVLTPMLLRRFDGAPAATSGG